MVRILMRTKVLTRPTVLRANMSKRKTVEWHSGDNERNSTALKKPHRNDSSSSSTSGEWLCASSRSRQPNEVSDSRYTSLSPIFRRSPKRFRRDSAISQTGSTVKGQSCLAAIKEVDASETSSKIEESPTKICFTLRSSERTSLGSRQKINLSKLASASLETFPKIEESPIKKCCTLRTTRRTSPESTNYMKVNFSQITNAAFETKIEESPIKILSRGCSPVASTSGSKQSFSTDSVVADSQKTLRLVKVRSFEGSHGQHSDQQVRPKKAATWPSCKTTTIQSEISADLPTPALLDSSPEKCEGGSLETSVKSQRIKRLKNSSHEVTASKQNLVTESDDEEYGGPEKFDVDENSRSQSKNPSTEKKLEYVSGDQSESSDEDDTVTRKSILRKNLTGVTRDFADYLLSVRSERVMARRDKNLSTFTYKVVDTVSAWGFSISWLSPKAIMYSKPFARDPSTVTLVHPVEGVITDPSNPDTPVFVNPIIVATGREITLANPASQ